MGRENVKGRERGIAQGAAQSSSTNTVYMFDPVELSDDVVQGLQEQAHDWAVAHGIMIIKKSEPGDTNPPGMNSSFTIHYTLINIHNNR